MCSVEHKLMTGAHEWAIKVESFKAFDKEVTWARESSRHRQARDSEFIDLLHSKSTILQPAIKFLFINRNLLYHRREPWNRTALQPKCRYHILAIDVGAVLL